MGSAKFRAVKRCIFCGNTADSKEHAWSEWALNRLGPYPGGVYGEFDGIVYQDSKQKHLRVKCVCWRCNEGWMKDLEDTILPSIGGMMLDEPRSLDIPQQWAIARWALKSSMVFEFISRTEAIFYTDSEREALRLSGAIPERTSVSIARSLGVETFFSFGNELTADQAQLNGLVTTIAYRHFVVQVVTVRANQPQGTRLVLDGNLQRWRHVPVAVWPTQDMARWPNAETIVSLDASSAFHSRFESASMVNGDPDDISTVIG